MVRRVWRFRWLEALDQRHNKVRKRKIDQYVWDVARKRPTCGLDRYHFGVRTVHPRTVLALRGPLITPRGEDGKIRTFASNANTVPKKQNAHVIATPFSKNMTGQEKMIVVGKRTSVKHTLHQVASVFLEHFLKHGPERESRVRTPFLVRPANRTKPENVFFKGLSRHVRAEDS